MFPQREVVEPALGFDGLGLQCIELLPVCLLPVSYDLSFLPQDERHPKEAFLSVFIDNYFSSVRGGKRPS